MFGGIVVKGDGIGRTLGFPTANIDCKPKEVQVTEGVYAAWAHINGVWHMAALVVSLTPWKVEVYVIDKSDIDLYGTFIQIDPVQRVSALQKYKTKKSLIRKIKNDVAIIRDILE
jgi:riboflavin kinase / FMN adenylyltransferase